MKRYNLVLTTLRDGPQTTDDLDQIARKVEAIDPRINAVVLGEGLGRRLSHFHLWMRPTLTVAMKKISLQVNAKQHGLSTTAFGQRVINTILLGVEDRFLKGRLAFDSSETIFVTRRILEALRANEVVLVAVNAYSGHRFVQVPIGHGGYAHFATTPANFASKGRTNLLGMSTIETIPFSEFRVVIRPVPERRDPKSGGNDSAIAEVIASFRDALEDVVLSHPAQCMGIGRELVGRPIEERPGFVTASSTSGR